eukprot:TRINITY_DN13014_c0_g1_i2.p1 TRINITY_DN13014_c0_g1~~TRINITY_DN13014_c0_g1_i2.p1  ORF type:complete len:179 (+),score=11.74 TRINITY_DN13014_c0_g1_i2:52-588(+)
MADTDEWSAPFHDIDTVTAVPYGDLHTVSPFVATPEHAIHTILHHLQLTPQDFLVDLGCGHGTINVIAAKKYSVRGLGVDIEPGLVEIAKENAIKEGVENLVEFRVEDVLQTDLSGASVVVSFLVPRHLKQIASKLKDFLTRGGRLACYHYPLQGVEPSKVIKLKEQFNKSIFFYNQS